jgi:hypothetical protein
VTVEPGPSFVVVDGRSTPVFSDGTILVSCGKVHTLREGNVERSILVPCDGSSPQLSVVRTAPRSVALTAVGVSLMALGAMSFVGGEYIAAESFRVCVFAPCPANPEQDRANAFLTAGVVLVVLSLPFLIIGQSRVPVGGRPSAITARAPRLGLSF